ncbi:MAG: prolipoprotein diacylglyceryl transferase [Saprospiraceae bacterium]|nr:prolipoprotein diacylglyceryl transferase [Saprospiraceae bacterium]
MWPDLSYIIHSITGVPPDNVFAVVKTFGLFLGFAFIASAFLAYQELKRKETRGVLAGREEKIITYQPLQIQTILLQMAIQFIIFSKLAYILQHGTEFIKDPASIVFSLKATPLPGLIAALVYGVYLFIKKSKQTENEIKYQIAYIHPKDRIYDITTIAALYGIIGSKLFSILENFQSFIKDPIGEFFSGSGLTIYGGLILAFIMVFRYVSKKGMAPLHVMDAVAPALMIGYCVGRMGCHFSGDGDWGIVNEMTKPGWFIFPDSWWAYNYPHNVLKEGLRIEDCHWEYCYQLFPPVFPTPLYEVLLAGLITSVLWVLRTHIHRAGVLFFIYCLLNGIERFFIEFLRVNPRYRIFEFDLSQAQFIALALIATGIGGIVYFWKKNIPN